MDVPDSYDDPLLNEHRDERYLMAITLFAQDPLDLLAYYQAANKEWREWADEELWGDLLQREWGVDLAPLLADYAPKEQGTALRHLFMAHAASHTMDGLLPLAVRLTRHGERYSVLINTRSSIFTIAFGYPIEGANPKLLRKVERTITSTVARFWPPDAVYPQSRGSNSLQVTIQQRHGFDTREAFVSLIFALLHEHHFRWRYARMGRNLSLFSPLVDRECGGCGAVQYCSEDCASAHWEEGGHARECSGIKKAVSY